MNSATNTASSVWQTVVGQLHAVQQLQQLATQSVHAYLFVGPEGCGKEEAARAFFERIFTGFHAMAAADPTRWLIVDGTPPKDELAATILTQVCERLKITLS